MVSGAPPQWPHTWDMAVRTMRSASMGLRAGWPGAEHLLATARTAQVRQPPGKNKDCGVCALMSAVGTLLRVPRPVNLLSALDRRWVAAVVLNRDMGPIAAVAAKPAPKAAPKPPPKRSPPPQYGGYANIRYVLEHFGGDLATEQRGSKAINVCPWSRLDGAGHCSWRAGKHCRPAHLHPKELLDHLQRDHAADPAQRDQALAMLAGIMPGGQAGPFASAQTRTRALTLPTSARPAGGQGASQSAAQPGAIGSAAQRGATTSTGSAAASASRGEAAGGPAASAGSKPAAAASGGDPWGQGPSRQPPAPGAGGRPPSNDRDPARGPGPQAQP